MFVKCTRELFFFTIHPLFYVYCPQRANNIIRPVVEEKILLLVGTAKQDLQPLKSERFEFVVQTKRLRIEMVGVGFCVIKYDAQKL